MTNAISIGARPVPAAVPTKQGAAIQAGGAIDFSSLVALGSLAGTEATGRIGPSPAPSVPTTNPLAGNELAGELGTQLSALLEKLATLSGKLEDGEPLDETELDELENLLAGIESLLDQGAPLPPLGSPQLSALAEVAAELGLDVEEGLGSLDKLAALSTKLAEKLRDEAPEIAARLTEIARSLDGHVATIQSAVADERSQAVVAIKHVESETRLNPAGVIAAQSGEPDPSDNASAGNQKTDTSGSSERSLVQGEQNSRPAPGSEARSAPQQGGAAGGPAATSPQESLETPDGLTVQTGQPQPSVSAPNASARPEAVLYQRPEAQINLPHIAAEISRHVQNGINRFEIRLNPPELGRIDVRMEMDNSGNVVARLAVERSETLDLLQRDQRALERALSEAGLDAAKTELEFSLGQQGSGNDGNDTERLPWRMSILDTASPPSQAAAALPDRTGYARLDAVNLWV